ncbi:hypothetical protein [Sinomonas sp. P47F7]|uniref:hypothetical protein n=1 Tax=Sinomonas sp. P47F7 TaxID=3410987 RepID=UPI003BF5D930
MPGIDGSVAADGVGAEVAPELAFGDADDDGGAGDGVGEAAVVGDCGPGPWLAVAAEGVTIAMRSKDAAPRL